MRRSILAQQAILTALVFALAALGCSRDPQDDQDMSASNNQTDMQAQADDGGAKDMSEAPDEGQPDAGEDDQGAPADMPEDMNVVDMDGPIDPPIALADDLDYSLSVNPEQRTITIFNTADEPLLVLPVDGIQVGVVGALSDQLELTHAHLDAFIKGMLAQLGCPITERQYDGRVWRVELTDALREVLATRAKSLRITTHRELAGGDIRVMDFDEPFFCHLIAAATSSAFGGVSAASRVGRSDESGEDGALGFVRVCWQSNTGAMMREEVVATYRDRAGNLEVNGPRAAAWLLEPALDREDPFKRQERIAIARGLRGHAETYLAGGSNAHLHPMMAQHLTMVSLSKV